jgi:Fe-S cluster biogenesis protein NfuA
MSEESAGARSGARLEEVEEIFDREIRPRLAAHLGGGNVTGIDADGVVQVEFTGACAACAYRRNTIVGAIYPRLRGIDGVRGVASPGVTVTIREQHRVAALYDDYGSRSAASADPGGRQ